MVNIDGKTTETKTVLLQRIFEDKATVHLISNTRIVSKEQIIENNKNDGDIYIYEKSVIQGYKDGGYAEITKMIVDGKNLIDRKTPIKVMTYKKEPEIAGIVTIKSDNDEYIANYIGNTIVLFAELSDLSETFLKIITNALGYKMLDDKEYLIRKLQNIQKRALGDTVANLERKIIESESNRRKAFNDYMLHHKTMLSLIREKDGAKNTEGRLDSAIVEQISRLLQSPFIDSMEIEGENIVILTKPLYISKWNIGQFKLQYRPETGDPLIERITSDFDQRKIKYYEMKQEALNSEHKFYTAHIFEDRNCTGNWREMLQSFWTLDMLTGFNRAIQYIRSYNNTDHGHYEWTNFLKLLGYLHDAELLWKKEIRIVQVDDGEPLLEHGKKISVAELEKAGCTFEVCTDPDEWERDIIKNQKVEPNTGKDLHPSIEYIDTTEK